MISNHLPCNYLLTALCHLKHVLILSIAMLTLTSTAQANTLDRLNWAPHVFSALDQVIQQQSKQKKQKQRPYALFDWDYTSAFRDCEEALNTYQIKNLRFKLTREQWNSLFPNSINGVETLEVDGRKISVRDFHEDIKTAYAELWDLTRGFTSVNLAELSQKSVYQDFTARVAFAYEAYDATPKLGADYSYVWILQLLAGHTLSEFETLAREALRFELGNALGSVTWKSPKNFSAKSGAVEVTLATGLRIHPEMQNLMSVLKTAGVDVFVVTASLKQLVALFAQMGGYPIAPDQVIGMELEIENNTFTTQYKPGWVRTYKQGKVEAVKRVINRPFGPLLVAGDSDGDVAMLTSFQDTKIRLILNRLKGGEIGKLSRQATEPQPTNGTQTLLHGRDENTGLFIPMSETIAPGSSEPRLLK